MKKKILLLDESITVQKVIALTLGKSRYDLDFATSQAQAMKSISDRAPDLILVSDQVTGVNVSTFPKELEAFMGRAGIVPPIVLITSEDRAESRNYAGVLKKPFSPQGLQVLVGEYLGGFQESQVSGGQPTQGVAIEDYEDQRLENIFNEKFSDESQLMRQTLGPSDLPNQIAQQMAKQSRQTSSGVHLQGAKESGEKPSEEEVPEIDINTPSDTADLWNVLNVEKASSVTEGEPPSTMETGSIKIPENRMENALESRLKKENLQQLVEEALARIVPPIVERLVTERLDALLAEQDQAGAKS